MLIHTLDSRILSNLQIKCNLNRRNFTNAGAGAGFASAFESPIGGTIFALEEVSSFWSMKLAWMTFFCCGLAGFVSDILNTGLDHGFKFDGTFGLIDYNKFIVFKVCTSIYFLFICHLS
jgi:H+/Cl- antiporter ClcA